MFVSMVLDNIWQVRVRNGTFVDPALRVSFLQVYHLLLEEHNTSAVQRIITSLGLKVGQQPFSDWWIRVGRVVDAHRVGPTPRAYRHRLEQQVASTSALSLALAGHISVDSSRLDRPFSVAGCRSQTLCSAWWWTSFPALLKHNGLAQLA